MRVADRRHDVLSDLGGSGSDHHQAAFLFCLVAFLCAAVHPSLASAQDARIQWMEYECGDESCLVLNAYRFSAAEEASPRPPDELAGMVLRLPVTGLPDASELNHFLMVVGAPDLNAAVQNLRPVLPDSARTSDIAGWVSFVDRIRETARLRIGTSHLHSAEVTDELRQTYRREGPPTPDRPIFPHLTRGVLHARTDSGATGDSIVTLEIGEIEYGQRQFSSVELFNLGVQPVRVYSEKSLSPASCAAFEAFELAPGDSVSRPVCLQGGLTLLWSARPTVRINYESGDERVALLQVVGKRASSLPATASAVVRSEISKQLAYWKLYPLYRIGFGLVCLGAAFFLLTGVIRMAPLAAERAAGMRDTWRVLYPHVREHVAKGLTGLKSRAASYRAGRGVPNHSTSGAAAAVSHLTSLAAGVVIHLRARARRFSLVYRRQVARIDRTASSGLRVERPAQQDEHAIDSMAEISTVDPRTASEENLRQATTVAPRASLGLDRAEPLDLPATKPVLTSDTNGFEAELEIASERLARAFEEARRTPHSVPERKDVPRE